MYTISTFVQIQCYTYNLAFFHLQNFLYNNLNIYYRKVFLDIFKMIFSDSRCDFGYCHFAFKIYVKKIYSLLFQFEQNTCRYISGLSGTETQKRGLNYLFFWWTCTDHFSSFILIWYSIHIFRQITC